MKSTANGIAVSDLHLFSSRSEGAERFDSLIRPRLKSIDALVFNGDIFDFRWACRPHSETIPEAIDWVSQLRAEHPDLKIFYVLGNHDCVVEFTNQLQSVPDISIHPHWLKLGHNLFLHGDAANFRMDQVRFDRFRSEWEKDQPKKRRDARLYDVSDRIQLSYLTHAVWFAGDIAIRRVSWHLDRVVPHWREDIKHCFFGHTHMPFQNRTIGDVKFHNTGSGIKRMGFQPVDFTWSSDTQYSSNEQ